MAMRVFVTILDGGSQSAAADQLGLSRPLVSRYLAELETWAGASLLHRTTRRLHLTAAGLEVLPRCRQLLELAENLRNAVGLPDDTPHGRLRITANRSFGQSQLALAVADYVKLHPRVEVDLVLLDQVVHPMDERIDLAISLTEDIGPNLISRRLSTCRLAVCAAPHYLAEKSAPKRVQELGTHNCLTHAYFGKTRWDFELDSGPVAVAVCGNISANDATTIVQAALHGAGIALLPTYLAAPLIRSGQLVALLPDAKPRELGIHAVYAARKNMTAALRSMLDFLSHRFGPEPSWDRETAA